MLALSADRGGAAVQRRRRIVARSTSTSPPRSWPAGSPTWSSRARSARCWPALAATLALALMRRFGRRWWIAGAVAVIALRGRVRLARAGRAGPAVQPLRGAAGRAHAQRPDRAGAQREGVDVDKVLVVDASRRTNAVNAYVTGLGHTKRIVLYDTLLEELHAVADQVGRGARAGPRQAARHRARPRHGARDLRPGGHVSGDAADGALVADATSARRRRDARRRYRRWPWRWRLSRRLGVVISNQLSRRVEARADQSALTASRLAALGDRARAAADRLESLRPDPPALLHALLGTHPTTVERIGAALTYEQRAPATGDPGR